MSVQTGTLRERDWAEVLNPLFSSGLPDRHVVLDGALEADAFAELRCALLSSWAWQYRAQPGKVLCLTPNQLPPLMRGIKDRLREILDGFHPGLAAQEDWAFLHQRPFEEFVHCDIGSYVWTLWLTPEEFDQSPETSGLQLFPLSRPAHLPNKRSYTLAYFEEKQVNRSVYIPYRENRAVIFPASTFHALGPCHFDASEPAKMRCSVSVFLDTAEHWRDQHVFEKVTSEKAGHEF
jgi:hypothetical protein